MYTADSQIPILSISIENKSLDITEIFIYVYFTIFYIILKIIEIRTKNVEFRNLANNNKIVIKLMLPEK